MGSWADFKGTMTLLLCCIVGVSNEVIGCTSRSCGPVNTSAEIHFRHDVELKIFNKKEWMNLDCCADGFTDILWHYRTASNTTWQAWPWFEPCVYCGSETPKFRQLCQQNQSLELKDPLPSDSGNYRCTVSNSFTGKELVREFTLVVGDCHDIPDGIQFIKEPDSLSQRAEAGSNVTFICSGNFGCPTHDLVRLANWSWVNSSGHEQELRPHQNRHFLVTYQKSFPYITISSSLTIVGIQESDYSLTLTCSLSTSRLHRAYNLTLHTPENIVELNPTVIIILSVVGSIALPAVICLIIYCCYKPKIQLHFRRLCGNPNSREPGEEDYHDGCIIHSEENMDFVEDDIKKPLQDEHYDIFTQKCVPEGAGELEIVNNIGKSMCAILVLSRAEIEDYNLFSFLFSVAVASCGSKMVVIEKEDIKENSWRSAIQGEEALQQLPRILKTVQWKGKDKMSRRQLGNFFSEIKLKLPSPQTPGGSQRPKALRIDSDSSRTRLISNQSDPLSTHPSLQSENGSRHPSKESRNGSHGLQTLSCSNNGERGAEVGSELTDDDVFNVEPVVIPKRSPQKQISCDSGIATSL